MGLGPEIIYVVDHLIRAHARIEAKFVSVVFHEQMYSTYQNLNSTLYSATFIFYLYI